MKKQLVPLIICLVILCVFPQLCLAKTGYVSDMLLLTFRQGPGNSHAVIKTLKSDTPVSILDEQNGFYQVELQSKEVGWVDKKFIVFDLPKTIVIDQLNQNKRDLEAKLSSLESSFKTMEDNLLSRDDASSQKITALEAALKTALAEKQRLNTEFSDSREKYNTLIKQSKNIQDIVNENKVLKDNNKTLIRDLQQLKGENKSLFKTGMIKWFLAGVGVLLTGWIVGQSVSSKKRGSGSSLLS